MSFNDWYNKGITTFILLYSIGMYTYSYISGRPLNIPELIGFLAPLTSQIVTAFSQAHITTKQADVRVAELQNSGPLPIVKPEAKT